MNHTMHNRLGPWLLALGMLLGTALGAQPALPSGTLIPPVVLSALQPTLEVDGGLATLTETGPSAGVYAIADGARGAFTARPSDTIYPLDDHHTLWVHLRLQRDSPGPEQWTLNIPLPYLDQVTLYQRVGAGPWTAQVSGDTLAVAQWTRPGLYPEFALDIPPRGAQEVYIQIRNFKPSSLPLRLATTTQRQLQRGIEYAVIGAMVGTLLIMLGSCAIQYAVSRELADAWYMAYTALMIVVICDSAGFAGQWFWPDAPVWANYSYMVLPVLGVGFSVLFVRHVSASTTRLPWGGHGLQWFGWACVPLVLLSALVERSTADNFYAVYLGLGPILALGTAVLTWWRGCAVGKWLFLAFLPQCLAVIFLSVQMFGLVPTVWYARYVLLLAVAFSVPLLLHALHMRARERHEVEERANALATQDALTGLLNRAQFATQVQAAIGRALEDKEPAAIVLVKVLDQDTLRHTHGDAVAEQCLLQAVLKMQRVLRDVDPAGRLDTAEFGLILEGVSSREVLTDRMVRLLASGLIPLPHLQPEITLHFHVTCVLLSELIPNAQTVLHQLAELMADMSPRTHRPIRFLEPEMTVPAALQAESGGTAYDTPGFGMLGP